MAKDKPISTEEWFSKDIQRNISFHKKAQNYLNAIQKENHQNIMKYGHTSMDTPYGDPSWSGGPTARMMMFQNWFRPKGIDLSDSAMTQAGESLSDKLQSIQSPQEAQQVNPGIIRLGNYLERTGARRGQDFVPQNVSDYLKLLKGGG